MLLVSFWLSDDRSVAGMNEAAELWLKELGGGKRYPLPIEVFAVAAKLRALDDTDGFIPRLRVRRRAGRWALLRAACEARQDDRDGPAERRLLDDAVDNGDDAGRIGFRPITGSWRCAN